MTDLRRMLAIMVLCGALVPSSAFAQETWALQPTPNGGEASHHNRLSEVGCDPNGLEVCMAVGTRSAGNVDYSLALRWDGVSWSYQPTPLKVTAFDTRLAGVDCPSATRCLAVGNVDIPLSAPPGPEPLAEIWTGGGWNFQSTPTPSGATSAELTDVGCNNTAECTAVGSAVMNGVTTAIAERWKSPTWAVQSVPIPAGATSSQLDGVACRWSNYCVAVGRYTASGGLIKSLAMFWDGVKWSLQTLTDPVGATQSTLLDVSCTGQPAVCMAVGGWKNGSDGNKQFPLAYRFNGSTWMLQSATSPSGSIAGVFQDVSCKTTTSCAAVGSWVSGSGGSNQTLAEDWSGSSWSLENTPNAPGATFSALFGLECRTVGCIGVGYSTTSGVNRNLSELRTSAPKTHLTYSIGIPPPNLPEGWENSLREAMWGWGHTTPLTFARVTPGPNKADLEFNWSYEAGNGQAFDGPGGKVVRAYGPLGSLSGDIYFDQGESWTTGGGSGGGIDIQSVAENAVAHALGITGTNAYETDISGQRGISWDEAVPAIVKYGKHPNERRYFLRNSNAEGVPDIVFEALDEKQASEFAGDWDGDGHDTIGWFEQHVFYFCEHEHPDGSCYDRVFLYSDPHTSGTNTPFEWSYPNEFFEYFDQTYDWFGGDWDGKNEGKETLGYYEGEFTLLDGHYVQYHFNYGHFIPGEGPIPLVGDWNGDGTDTIGVFFRSNSTFYLRNSNAAGNADITIPSYAVSGDQPVVGDWNGDGKDTIGTYRPSSGQWRLNDENANNSPEYTFYYGNVGGWVRIVGDWNGDGKDTPGFAQD